MRDSASGSQGDPLKMLGVLQRLEVGPVQLEKRRLIAQYAVTQKGNVDSTELIYRFEEDVFTPGEPESLNLASMIAAQVALNYGLFCDEMVFHGWFDDADQSFLKGMAENTAREVFVKKFLEPNPFLRGPVTELSPGKRKTYLRSQMIFDQQEPEAEKRTRRNQTKKMGWALDPSRHAILSSGGKDSLLSFGLLREAGYEVEKKKPPKFWNVKENRIKATRELCRTLDKDPKTIGRDDFIEAGLHSLLLKYRDDLAANYEKGEIITYNRGYLLKYQTSVERALAEAGIIK